MAIDICLMVEKISLKDADLVDQIKFLGGSVVNEKSRDGHFSINSAYDRLGFYVSLYEKTKLQFGHEIDWLGGYDVNLNGEFWYKQNLCFNINHELEPCIAYRNVIHIIFAMMKKSCSKAVLDFNGYMDLCLFLNNQEVIINKTGGKDFWEWPYYDFKNILSSWKCIYV